MSLEESANEVRGERGATVVHSGLSLQSRLSSLLAVALMSALGLGSLTWYYAHTLMQQGQTRARLQSAAASRAQGDAAVPALGRIDPPAPPPMPQSPAVALEASAERTEVAHGLAEIPLLPASANAHAAEPQQKTPAELARERELSGAVFIPQGAAPALTAAAAPYAAPGPDAGVRAAEPDGGALAALLKPTVAQAVRAQLLPARRLLLPRGSFIDCTLETAIDSTLPGMTTCVVATDAFGVDGNVVLLERGTKLIGETRGQVQQGAARVFVLWTEARTPQGVIVPLDSPGTDELGRSGLPGEVNYHFWQRFGAALLLSVIDGAVTAAVQSRSDAGTVVIAPSASQGIATEVLKGTINIAPTVIKRNGDRIQVLVARDLDFRSVYELRSAASAH